MTQKEKGRPANITYKLYDKDEVKDISSDARFHCWGHRRLKGEQKVNSTETVGICELTDGQIRLVLPEKIKFLDK